MCHWLMYALTTILLSAVIIQIIFDYIGHEAPLVDNFLPDTDAEIKSSYVLYVIFFTLVHGYPSTRASVLLRLLMLVWI